MASGNEFLFGRTDESYYPNGSTFRFCKSVKFMELERAGDESKEEVYAENPNSWFSSLKDSGVNQLRVRYMRTDNSRASDRMTAGLAGGGGRWQIQAVKNSSSDLWEGGCEVGFKNNPDKNIWHVKYGRIAKDVNEPERVLYPVADVKATLYGALTRISEFAHKHNQSHFGESFDRAIKALSDDLFTFINLGYIVATNPPLISKKDGTTSL